MNDPRRMRRIERVGDLNGKRQEQIGLQETAGDTVLQHDAIQKFHGDECPPILFANVINCADVGMVQCGSGLRFASKPGEYLWVTRNVFRQEL